MIKDIFELKNSGFSKTQVSNFLSVDIKTVSKYWLLNSYDEIEKFILKNHKTAALSKHESDIWELIDEIPNISAEKVRQYLFNKFRESYSERTISSYLCDLRYGYDAYSWDDEENREKIKPYLFYDMASDNNEDDDEDDNNY